MTRAELKRGADFAEFAEAVGVPTSQVIAVQSAREAFVIIYTPDPLPADDPDGVDTTAWSAGLGRDDDAILRVIVDASPTPFSVHDICRALAAGL